MPESFVQVTEGAGKKLHTFQRTVGVNTVEDEVVVPGEPHLAAYSIVTSVGTIGSGDHLLQIMAGASLPVRIRRITVAQAGASAAGGVLVLSLTRLTTAGTGGAAITPRPYDSTDPAAGATAMAEPTSTGTIGVELAQLIVPHHSASPIPAGSEIAWDKSSGLKAPRIPAGAANGVVLRVTGITGTATGLTLGITVEIEEATI